MTARFMGLRWDLFALTGSQGNNQGKRNENGKCFLHFHHPTSIMVPMKKGRFVWQSISI